jgi:DNA-directed RNA polymerase subunit beta'
VWGPKQQASQPHPYITGLQALIRVFDAELPLGEDGLPPQAYLDEHGPVATALALIAEAQFIYRQQGVVINDKHYEVVLREMLGTVEVTDPGDTGFYPTQRVSRAALRAENERVAAAGQRPAAVRPLISGVMEAGQSSDSFLAAASSYHTISVLAEVALRRATDDLDGMRENLIIGGLIPAGSGYREGGSGGV